MFYKEILGNGDKINDKDNLFGVYSNNPVNREIQGYLVFDLLPTSYWLNGLFWSGILQVHLEAPLPGG